MRAQMNISFPAINTLINSLAAPTVSVTADHTRVVLRGSVTLTCTVTRANPTTYSYSWKFNEELLVGQVAPTLRLSSFTSEDVGTYTCQVMNHAGPGMDSIDIRFDSKLYYYCFMGMNMYTHSPVTVVTRVRPEGPVLRGSTIDLICEATNAMSNAVSYSWSGPSGQIVSDEDIVTITISGVGDYGIYTCTATTDIGIGYGNATVMHSGRPFCSV
jgi:hypothetical protein